MTYFNKIIGYPKELEGRFNSFITTQFDDSLSVEMQLRSLIKWIMETIDLVNEMTEYLNLFIDRFDKTLQVEIVKKLNEWMNDGTLAHIINEEVFDMKVDREEFIVFENELRSLLDQKTNEINQVLDQKTDEINQAIEQQQQEVSDSLKAYDERITEKVSINKYNVDPTGQEDSLGGFIQAINELEDHEELVLDKNATYYFSNDLRVEKAGIYRIQGNGSHILSNANSSEASYRRHGMYFSGELKQELNALDQITKGKNYLTFSNIDLVEVGDLLYFTSEDQYNNSRPYYKKGGSFSVTFIDRITNRVYFNGSFPYDIDSTLRVYLYDPVSVEIENLSLENVNPLPNGKFGIAIEWSVDSKLNKVQSDNFDHCITFRYHVNTLVERVRTMRSYFEGTSESYGMSSYVGSYLNVKNSHFRSGRHGLEISGFENSFKTKIENSSFYSENGEFDFNTHQCSYDLVMVNCTMGTFGLCNKSMLINCQIGREDEERSALKSGTTFDDTRFIFKGCHFLNKKLIRLSTDHSGTNPEVRYGLLKFEDNVVDEDIRIEVSLSARELMTDKIIVDNTNNIGIVGYYPTLINELIYKDSVFNTTRFPLLQFSSNSGIKQTTFSHSTIYMNGSGFEMFQFRGRTEKITFDNIRFLNNGSGKSDLYVSAPSGEIYINNSNLTHLRIYVGNLNRLMVANSYALSVGQPENITTALQTTMESI